MNLNNEGMRNCCLVIFYYLLFTMDIKNYYLIVSQRKALEKQVEALKQDESIYIAYFREKGIVKDDSEFWSFTTRANYSYDLVDPTILDKIKEEHPEIYDSCIDVKKICQQIKDFYPKAVTVSNNPSYIAKPDPSLWSE